MKKRKRVVIIHFQPLELFPPAMNMIDFLAQNNLIEFIVITTKKRKVNHLNTYQNAKVRIRRPAKQSARSIERYLNYFWFYLSAFSLLLKYKPAIVWYFETLSS